VIVGVRRRHDACVPFCGAGLEVVVVAPRVVVKVRIGVALHTGWHADATLRSALCPATCRYAPLHPAAPRCTPLHSVATRCVPTQRYAQCALPLRKKSDACLHQNRAVFSRRSQLSFLARVVRALWVLRHTEISGNMCPALELGQCGTNMFLKRQDAA
jgi:hypothetical protein